MSPSFEEKSVWVQLAGTLIGMGAYFVIAAQMMAAGLTALPAYVGLFVAAIVLMVVVLVAGHIAAAVMGSPEKPDERDRLIGWRAESGSSWVLGAGVVTAIIGMMCGIENVWNAHLLLASLFISEVLGYTLRIVYYRRGMGGVGG